MHTLVIMSLILQNIFMNHQMGLTTQLLLARIFLVEKERRQFHLFILNILLKRFAHPQLSITYVLGTVISMPLRQFNSQVQKIGGALLGWVFLYITQKMKQTLQLRLLKLYSFIFLIFQKTSFEKLVELYLKLDLDPEYSKI